MQAARRKPQQPAPKSTPRPPAKQLPRPAAQPIAKPLPRALIPESVAIDFDRVDGTGMFDTLDRVRALPAGDAIAETYGYARSDLFAIAEIGRHYLESGGYRLAAVIFEGLEAIAPEEPYFVLALGLAKDRLGDKEAALARYRRAQSLDPKDARADLNVAELLIEAGRSKEAVRVIEAAERKAMLAEEEALAKKANALLSLLGVRS
jgi:tetratricopeptide (TPR) repeat protein